MTERADALATISARLLGEGFVVPIRPFDAATIAEAGPHSRLPACLFNGGRTRTEIRYHPQLATAAILYHELVHAELNLSARRPRLRPAPGVVGLAATMTWTLCNDLEHLVVIPREIEQYPEAAEYWNSNYIAWIAEADASSIPPARRDDLLRHHLIASKVLAGSPAAQAAEAALARHGWLDDGERLVAEIELAAGDKAKEIDTMFAFLKLPRRRDVSIFIYDPDQDLEVAI